MGYSNNFKLRVEGEIKTKVKFCKRCNISIEGDFCKDCGSKMQFINYIRPGKEVIPELLDSYPEGDCSFLIDDDGNSLDSGSGHSIEGEIKNFSKKYPDLTFILSCQWEYGLVEEGEPGTDYYFFINGEKRMAKVEVKYTNPFTGEFF